MNRVIGSVVEAHRPDPIRVAEIFRNNQRTLYGIVLVAGHPLGGEAGAALEGWLESLTPLSIQRPLATPPSLHVTLGTVCREQEAAIRRDDLAGIDFDGVLHAIAATQPFEIEFRRAGYGEDANGRRDGNVVIEAEGSAALPRLRAAFAAAGVTTSFREPVGSTKAFLTLAHLGAGAATHWRGVDEWMEAVNRSLASAPRAFRATELKAVLFSRRILTDTVVPDFAIPLGMPGPFACGADFKEALLRGFENARESQRASAAGD